MFTPIKPGKSASSPPPPPPPQHHQPEQEYGIRVRILEGMSHAFFNMKTFLPEVTQANQLVSEWFLELLKEPPCTRVSGGGGRPGHEGEEVALGEFHTPLTSPEMTRLSVVGEQSVMARRREGLASQHLKPQ